MARKKMTRVVATKPVSTPKPEAEPMAPVVKKPDIVLPKDGPVPLTLINEISRREAAALEATRNAAHEAAKLAVDQAFSRDTPYTQKG